MRQFSILFACTEDGGDKGEDEAGMGEIQHTFLGHCRVLTAVYCLVQSSSCWPCDGGFDVCDAMR
jgi:hypothetical protein